MTLPRIVMGYVRASGSFKPFTTSSSVPKTLGTADSKYRPPVNVWCNGNGVQSPPVFGISANGGIILAKQSSANDVGLYGGVVYPLANPLF